MHSVFACNTVCQMVTFHFVCIQSFALIQHFSNTHPRTVTFYFSTTNVDVDQQHKTKFLLRVQFLHMTKTPFEGIITLFILIKNEALSEDKSMGNKRTCFRCAYFYVSLITCFLANCNLYVLYEIIIKE